MADSAPNKWLNRFLITVVVVGTSMLLYGVNHYRNFQHNVTRLSIQNEFAEFLVSPEMPVSQDDARLYFGQACQKASEFSDGMLLDEKQQVRVDAESIRQFEGLLRKHDELFGLINEIVEAKKLSFAYSKDRGMLPEPLKVMKIANVLQAKARVADAKEDWETSVNVARQMFEIARKIERGPSLMNSLLGISVRHYGIQILYKLVAVDSLSKVDAQEFLSLLETIDPMNACTRSFRFERFMVMHNARLSKSINSALFHWFSGNHYLKKMSRIIAISSGKISDPIPPQPYSLIDTTLEAFGQVDFESAYLSLRHNFARDLVGIRSAKIMLTLQASGIPKADWSIEQAKQLGLDASDLEDPFTAKSLLFTQTDGMVKIYSAGPNRIDENGKDGTDDSGLTPSGIFQ